MIEIFLQNNLRITAFKKHLSLWFVWINLEHGFYYWRSCWPDLSEVGHWRLRNSSCHFLQTASFVERFFSKVAFLIAETYQFYDNQRFKFTGFSKAIWKLHVSVLLGGRGENYHENYALLKAQSVLTQEENIAFVSTWKTKVPLKNLEMRSHPSNSSYL